MRVIPHRRIIIPFNPQLLHESVYSVSFRLDGLLSTNLHGGEELCIQASKNININNGGNDMIYVGIDVAKTKHDFFIVGERGERIAGPVTIKNNLNGFNTLVQAIEDSKNNNDVYIGMESTGHYGNNILHFLYEKGFTLYVMNPKLTSDIRKAGSLRKTKTDKIDCRAIANIVRTHYGELEPYTIKSYHIEQLKSLTRYRQDLVNDRSRLKNSVKRLVNILFPEYDAVFCNLHGIASYAILSEFPNKVEISNANIIRLTNVICQASNGKYGREMAEKVRELARNSIGSISPVQSRELQETIERIQELSKKIDEIEQEIEERTKELNSPIFTIPGIGKVLGAAILAEIGNIARFKSPDKLVAYAGLSPTIYQSGQYVAPIARMEKRGSRQFRYAIMLAAEIVSRNCPYFMRQMAQKRAEGKSYRVAVSHVARNLIRLIYRMELTGKAYQAPAMN